MRSGAGRRVCPIPARSNRLHRHGRRFMTLDPLLNTTPMIRLHALTALAVLGLTLTIFLLPRGRRAHRVLGWTWVVAMAVIAISSFWIHTIGQLGPFSLIHLLSI